MSTLSESFRAAVRTHNLQPASSPDGVYNADEFGSYMDRVGTFPKEVLAVLAEIQMLRDQNPALDQWLRERGIVTRERKVRA
jgi:hypothetical protein